MAEAIRDENHVTSTLLESSTTPGLTINAKGNEATGRLLVEGGGGASVTVALPTAGAVDGSNQVFTFAAEPIILVSDNITLRKTSSNGTPNWTGTTTITLAIAPNYDLYSII